MKPRIVFNCQAPYLLKQWAHENAHWSVEVAPWEASAELWRGAAGLTRWDGRREGVAAVVVNSPASWHAAGRDLPGVRLLWLMHYGIDHGIRYDMAPEILVCLESLVPVWSGRYPLARVWSVSPHYRPEPRWKWQPGTLWTMLSNPQSRLSHRYDMTREVVGRADCLAMWKLYGERQILGLLREDAREALVQSSSAYVDVLPPFAGFGLAHHEALAAGVPLVSTRWGDMPQTADPRHESLNDDLGALASVTERVTRDQQYAEQMGAFGPDYIAQHRTLARLNLDIDRMLSP